MRRDRAPHRAGGARAACRSTRSRCSCARRSATSACSSTRSARVPTSGCARAGSIAARAVRIPAGRAFLAILACACEHLSARRFAEYLSLAQVPRLDEAHAAGIRAAGGRGTAAARTRGPRPRAADRRDDEPRTSDVEPPTSRASTSAVRRRRHRRRHAAGAVEVGDADRRVGGDRRRSAALAPAADRAGERDAAAARRRAEGGSGLGQGARGSSATCATSATCARSRCRSSICSRRGRRAARGASGSIGSPRWRRMVLRQPERVLRVLEQLRPMAEIGPVSLDEARDVIADRLQMLELDPPRSRYGRVFVGSPHQARGRTFRVVFVAGLAERMFPQRPHEDPMLLDREMRAPLDAGLRAAGGSRAHRAPAAAPRRRRADRAAVAVVSAPRNRRVAPARAELLRARRHARDHRPHSAAAAAAGCRGRRRGRRPRLARARAPGGCDRRSRARPLRACAQLLQVEPRASVRGHAHYLLQSERVAQAIGQRAMGARPFAVDAVRRHHARDRDDQADARVAAARRAAVFAVGAAEIRGLSRTSSCSRRSTGSNRRRTSSRCRSSIR